MARSKSLKQEQRPAEHIEEDEELEDAEVTGPSGLPANLEVQHTQTVCGPDVNFNTGTITSANVYAALGVSNAWDHGKWANAFRITKVEGRDSDFTLEFEMVGVDPSIANALRRILIAEVPTMAIEHVFYINNTSVISDEVLAHRLGLVPLQVDPELFDWKTGDDVPTEKNTIVFSLQARCRRMQSGLHNDHLKWLPNGSSMPSETKCRFGGNQQSILPHGAALVEPHIQLARLGPGQEIQLEAHCIKGAHACHHAKWSPVATAWYKLRPEIVVLKPVRGQDAEDLAAECPHLFQVKGAGNTRELTTQGPSACWLQARRLSGEDRWKGAFELRKHKDKFIFTIESTGAVPAAKLLKQAADVLISKCDKLLESLE
eukprot:jgi/Astpho2/4993/e_gw1.00070.21.1_t